MANKKIRSDSTAKKVALEQKKNVKNQVNVIKKVPATIALVYEALVELDNKKASGSSFKTIKKYIITKYGVEPNNLRPTCKVIMKQEINAGNIIQVGRKFLLTRQKKQFVKLSGKKQPKNYVEVAINDEELAAAPVKKGKKVGKAK